MGKFKVRYQDLDQLGQLFTRQQGHMNSIQTYVTTNCEASAAFEGPVLGLLADHYTSAYTAGKTGFGNGATIAEACSGKIGETKSTLVEHEKEQIKKYNKHAKELGLEPHTFVNPESSPLGPPETDSKAHTEAGPSAYEQVMAVNGTANQAVNVGTTLMTTTGDPLGLTQGEEPGRRGDLLDPNAWFERAKARGVDHMVGGHGGRTLPDGTHIPQSELDASRQRHLTETYDRSAGNGQETVYRHVDPDTRHEHSYTPGSIWDDDTGHRVHRTAGDLRNAAALPGQMVGSVKGLMDAGHSYEEAVALHRQITEAAGGPSNDGSITWAQSGDGW